MVDVNGETIIGARVSVVGDPSKGTMTDIDGAFSLPGMKVGDTIEVAYVGYATQQIKIQDRSALTITLKEDEELLEEVVVTAFGTGQKKASVVGSIQTVRPSELKVPSNNLTTSFAGRLAGVISVQRSGAPGDDGAANFWIRGISSVNATSPLIILDGVQIAAQDLNALDPEVIEGFSILKDATATALYGSRGANGVVIVTTKTGANMEKPAINVRLEAYLNTPTSVPQFVDGVDYVNLYNEAIRNYSTGDALLPQSKIDGMLQGLDPYLYPNVNWYNEIFKNYTFNQKANLNIRGGGKRMNYFMSLTADHQTGLQKPVSKNYYDFDNSEDYWRLAFQNNIELNVTETTKLALRLNAQINNSKGPVTSVNDTFKNVINSNPVDFPIAYPKSADESRDYILWGGTMVGPARIPNPMADAVNGYSDNFQSAVIANIELNQDLKFITEGLRFTALASFKNWASTTKNRYRNHNFLQSQGYEEVDGIPDYKLKLISTEQSNTMLSSGSTAGDRRIYFHAMLMWDRKFGDHALGAMFNYNQEETAINTANDNILNNLPKRKQGIAGRLTYSYADKYILEANFGYNGSENFAPGHRFGFFPSVALGYNVSEERFWEPLKDIFPLFKLRGSWGLVGNDQIGGDRFVYLSNVQLGGGNGYTTGINQNYSMSGPKYNRFENPGITWEVGDKKNLGFDLQIFQPLRLNVDIFSEYRTNVFQQRGAVPSYMGTASTAIFGNLAEISNHGLDASLEYNQQITKDLFLSVRGTFTYAKNRVEKWDEPIFMEYPQLSQVGKSLNTNVGLVAERLFIDEAEVAASPTQTYDPKVSGGDIKYTDQPNKDGEYDGQIDNNDRVYMGYPTVPQIIYGFGANLRYKAIDFGFFFQGVGQTSMMLSGFHPFGTQYNRNVLQFIADDRWSPENPNIYAAYPRLTKRDMPNNTEASSYWLRDGSFLKLKNLELGYNFKMARIYVSGINVVTFSKFKLWDPERGGGSGLSYPTMRTFNIGVQMNF